MRLAFLSDLHLAPPATSRCTTPPDALEQLARELLAGHDELIVVGDLVDLSRPVRPGAWRAHLDASRAAHPALALLLERATLIYGNHDEPLRLLGAQERVVRHGPEDDQGGVPLRVLILHGHQWDVALKRVPGLAALANFVAGWGVRLGVWQLGAFMEEALGVIERLLHERARRHAQSRGAVVEEAGRMERAIRDLIAREGWDVVVTGHSHDLALKILGDGLWINTGAHCSGSRDLATLDTDMCRATITRDGQTVATATRDDGTRWRLGATAPPTRATTRHHDEQTRGAETPPGASA